MKNHHLFSTLTLCFVLIAAFFPTQKTIATPLPPIAGTLTVNTAADVISSDNYLSLREAMEIAAGTFAGPFTANEQAQMAGCLFDFLGIIYSGCGAGLDQIIFAPSLTEIVLVSRLPDIIKDGDVINGTVSAGNIIINANAVVDQGFWIDANFVILENLTIVNVAPFGSAIIMGNSHKGNQIYNNYLGVFPDTNECSDSNITARTPSIINIVTGSGTAAAGDGTAYIDNNVIGCALHDGIDLQLVPYVYIGQNISGGSIGNWIGVSRSGRDYSNMGNGVGICCTTATTGTQITNNHIAFNDLNGIILTAVTNSTINNNDIYNNNDSGIQVRDTSLTILNNNRSHDNAFGIWFVQINPSPLVTTDNKITGGAYYRNYNVGIGEGGGAGNNTWYQVSTYDNTVLGIDTNGNFTPDPPAITLTGTTPASPGVLVHGTLDVPLVFLFYTYHIELYLVSPDPTGYGEGSQYIGATDVSWNLANDYTWSIPNPLGAGCYTATLTIRDDLNPSNTYSSEFATNLGTKCFLGFLPAVFK